MVRRPYQAPRRATLLILPLLAGLTALWMQFRPPVTTAGVVRLRMALPAQLGAFESQVILHCQNDQCRKSFPVASESALAACPVCGGALLPMALSERDNFSPDTQIARRLYYAPNSPFYTVTIVLSGAEHRSIHRPQQCLPAGGILIDREHVESLALSPDRALRVMILDVRMDPDPRSRFGFAYWFVEAHHETPSHYARLFWTTYDRLFRGIASRWAYIAVTASEPLDTPESRLRLAAFLRPFLEVVEIPQGASS